MILRNYNNFIKTKLLLENLDAAKNILRRKILDEEKKKNPDLNLTIGSLEDYSKEIKKDPRKRNPIADKILAADKNPEFQKIIQMLGDKIGWAGTFVKFHFEGGISLEELQDLINKINLVPQQDLKGLKNADFYGSVVATDSDKKTGFEVLSDDLSNIEINRSVANFIRQLPGDFMVKNEYARDKGQTVPSFRKAAREAVGKVKEQIKGIALAFEELGTTPEEKKSLQRLFMTCCLRYRTLSEVIQKAIDYIDAASKKTIADLLLTIDKANMDFGFMNGAEIVYNEKNIVIFEVKSFQANVLINSATKHCIKDSYSNWESYVSAESLFNKQYYIWNFNKSSADNEFIIGVTVEPEFKIRAAHFKDDAVVSNIKTYVKNKLKIDFEEYFLPMSQSEITSKKKRIEANRTIIKDNLSFEEAKKCLEDGADPNIKDGKPLEKAVSSDNLELVKLLLEKGAKTSIGKPMRFAKSFDMIGLLIKHGAQVEEKTLDNCVKDVKAVKLLLTFGLDPNSRDGSPIVSAVKNNAIESLKILIESGGEFYLRRWRALKIAIQIGNKEILEIIFNHIKSKGQKIDEDDKEELLIALQQEGWQSFSNQDDSEIKKLVFDNFKQI